MKTLPSGKFEVHLAEERHPELNSLQEVIDFFVKRTDGKYEPVDITNSHVYVDRIDLYDKVPGGEFQY